LSHAHKGCPEQFFPTPNPENPPLPQFTLKRHDFEILAPNIKISAPKFKKLLPNSQDVALNSNNIGKIQIK